MHLAAYHNFINTNALREYLYSLPGMSCVWLDDAAIMADFPGLAEQAFEIHRNRKARRSFLADWMVRMAGVISQGQLGQTVVNTPILRGQGRRFAFRPPRYGRSAVVSVPNAKGRISGFLDIKGCGIEISRKPSHGDHQNGLLSLPQAFEELIQQRLVAHVLKQEMAPLSCLPIYAIMMCPFAVKMPSGGQIPASYIVRRPHLRAANGVELPQRGSALQQTILRIEFMMRRYGLTTSSEGSMMEIFEDDSGKLHCRFAGYPLDVSEKLLRQVTHGIGHALPIKIDGINLQYAAGLGLDPPTGAIVDFGHFEVRERFERPILSLVRDRALMWGGCLSPNDPRFVQPDPALAFDPDLWVTRPASDEMVEAKLLAPGERAIGLYSQTTNLALACAANNLDIDSVEARLARLVCGIIKSPRPLVSV